MQSPGAIAASSQGRAAVCVLLVHLGPAVQQHLAHLQAQAWVLLVACVLSRMPRHAGDGMT
jgi:hypothetical protein